ncbi:nucleotidyltransferase domain-containing protein [Streptomyces sp. INA 01156]
MGSRAFGLATEGSDTDRRGVFLAHSPVLALREAAAHVEGPAEEQFSWELERFCELALRANPNILECLHSPLVEHADGTGRELLALRGAFLSRQVHDVHPVRPQPAPQTGGRRPRPRAPRWKHAMHLLRLLASARDVLRTGTLTIDVGEERSSLLAVKRGEVAWSEVEARMTRLEREAGEAVRHSPLPRNRTVGGWRTSSSAPATPRSSGGSVPVRLIMPQTRGRHALPKLSEQGTPTALTSPHSRLRPSGRGP